MKKWIESSDRGRGGGEACRQRKKGRRRSDGVHARETKNFGMVPRGGGVGGAEAMEEVFSENIKLAGAGR